MATWHSARIQACQQQNYEETVSRTSNDAVALALKVFCLCCLPEDGYFMICCDHCGEWYHGDCVGITPEIGQEMNDDNMEYTCPCCTSDTTLVSSTSMGPHRLLIHVNLVWSFSGEIKMVKLFAS